MSETKKLRPINRAELAAKGVVALSNTPNAKKPYGVGGLTPAELKAWFDKLGVFLADKINELQSTLSSADAADYIFINSGNTSLITLGDFIRAAYSGYLADTFLRVNLPEYKGKTSIAAALSSIVRDLISSKESVDALERGAVFGIETDVSGNTAAILLKNKAGEEISRAQIDLTVTEERLSKNLRGRIETLEGSSYTDVIYNKTTGQLSFITASGMEESIFLPLPDASRGDPGKSAYEIACEHGFSGTEAAWLDSLQGDVGLPGPKGDDGKPFMVSKVYSSVAAMNSGYKTDGLPVGAFVVIDTGNVEDEENARLYIKGEAAYEFITDLSGAEGIQGPPGASVTVSKVQESAVDGGSNVVTFSDGNALSVKNGSKGTAVGIVSVSVSTSAGGINRVEFTDGNMLEVRNGANGKNGEDGAAGERGTGILKVSTSLTSYTTTTGGKNPIKRMKISTIKNEANVSEVLVGDLISQSYYLYHIYYLDATYAYMDTYTSIRGATGSKGEDGADGKDGAAGADGKDGANGKDGADGKDGAAGERGTGILNITGGLAAYTTAVNGMTPAYRILISRVITDSKVNTVIVGDTIRYSTFLYPIIYVDATYAYCSARITIKGADGTNGKDGAAGADGQDGYTPVKGVDYFTESDKAEMIQAVMDGIGSPVFGFVDENNNIILKGTLTEDNYSVKYEMEDGSIVDIGELSFVPEVTYTDLVPTAKGSDGSVLNGVGYQRDARWSTSAGTLTTGVTGYTAIGLSPITGGKPLTVYVYGLELDGTSYSALIANKLLTGTVKDFSYKLTAGFTGTTFVSKVEKLANYYYKITTLATDSTAAYFALCGKTVSSMTPIVTLNEPIM